MFRWQISWSLSFCLTWYLLLSSCCNCGGSSGDIGWFCGFNFLLIRIGCWVRVRIGRRTWPHSPHKSFVTCRFQTQLACVISSGFQQDARSGRKKEWEEENEKNKRLNWRGFASIRQNYRVSFSLNQVNMFSVVALLVFFSVSGEGSWRRFSPSTLAPWIEAAI